jgi:hypothetical protein
MEQARKLPDQLADLPVTAASRAVQAGMRVQQRVTELAIKGDEVFSLFSPVEDTPPWARFDEDDKPPRPGTEATSSAADGSGRAGNFAAGVPAPGAGQGRESGQGREFSQGREFGQGREFSQGREFGQGREFSQGREFGEVDEADVAHALTPPHPTGAAATPGNAGLTASALPGYDELSLAQLRGKLRELSLPQLAELLEYEHVHQDRPAYVTLLSNRISTVRSQ